jgi:hypothetical protein
MRRELPVLIALVLGGCKPTTARPFFPPVTGAAQADIELEMRNATGALADVLRSDSLPLTRVAPIDGYIETAWFDVRTKRPTHARRLGPNVVQVRAWVDPAQQGHSRLTIETVYRPLADPSLSARELERQVPPDHLIGKRMTEIVVELAKLYETRREPQPAGQ